MIDNSKSYFQGPLKKLRCSAVDLHEDVQYLSQRLGIVCEELVELVDELSSYIEARSEKRTVKKLPKLTKKY